METLQWVPSHVMKPTVHNVACEDLPDLDPSCPWPYRLPFSLCLAALASSVLSGHVEPRFNLRAFVLAVPAWWNALLCIFPWLAWSLAS